MFEFLRGRLAPVFLGKDIYMTKTLSVLTLIAVSMFAGACDEPAEAKPSAEEAKPAAPPEKTAEEKAAEEKAATAAAEAEKKAEEAKKAEEELAKNPLTECCRSLGQKGYAMRSAEYMSASKVCGSAMTDKKTLQAALGDIKKELKAEPLPDTCAAK